MAIESPLFQSAMELLGHSYSHFNNFKELDRKLVILHLANSIELVLKDLVLDSGESIYKGPKETITIHGCFKVLREKDVKVPYLNKVELLIDERNALQHRFGSPNELTTIFYMNIAQDFFKEILREHYDQEYEEIIVQFADEKEFAAFKLREPIDESELENLKKLAGVHALGATLSAMSYVEKLILEFGEQVGLDRELRRRAPWHATSPRYLMQYGIPLPDDLARKMDELRKMRNLAAHGRSDPSKKDVSNAIEVIEEFEKYLDSLNKEETRESVATELRRIEKERETRRERIMVRRTDD